MKETARITLNDLLNVVDTRQLRVIVPVTQRLKARIVVNTRQTAELEDIIALYGDCAVYSAEPVSMSSMMDIELTPADRPDLGMTKGEVSL